MSPVPDAAWNILDWDSAFFGFRIARVSSASSADALAVTVEECARQGVQCLYYLAEAGDIATIRLLEHQGFGFTDLRLTMVQAAPGAGLPGEVRGIRLAREEDLPALRPIARVSHRNSRFYADSHFPTERCDDLYDTWIVKSCTGGYADATFVAETVEGTAGGYITCSMIQPDRGQIGLLAVAPELRGGGAGRRLIEQALSWARGRSAASVITVTQGGNPAAIRAYERCGFIAERMQVWYHRWLDSAVDRVV